MSSSTERATAGSVDEIAAFAGLTKRTLYYHFESKDQLLGSVLALHSELALARIRKYEGRYSGSPDQIIEVLFSELAKWSAKPSWTGAGFTRLVIAPPLNAHADSWRRSR